MNPEVAKLEARVIELEQALEIVLEGANGLTDIIEQQLPKELDLLIKTELHKRDKLIRHIVNLLCKPNNPPHQSTFDWILKEALELEKSTKPQKDGD